MDLLIIGYSKPIYLFIKALRICLLLCLISVCRQVLFVAEQNCLSKVSAEMESCAAVSSCQHLAKSGAIHSLQVFMGPRYQLIYTFTLKPPHLARMSARTGQIKFMVHLLILR